MKKLLAATLAAVALLLTLSACGSEPECLVFTAEIVTIGEESVTVCSVDGAVFDEAVVLYGDDMEPVSFNLIVGQRIRITAFPDIAETVPIQVTAVSLELAG